MELPGLLLFLRISQFPRNLKITQLECETAVENTYMVELHFAEGSFA